MARPKQYNTRLPYTVNCERDIYEQFRKYAASTGKSVSELLQEYMVGRIEGEKEKVAGSSDWAYSGDKINFHLPITQEWTADKLAMYSTDDLQTVYKALYDRKDELGWFFKQLAKLR